VNASLAAFGLALLVAARAAPAATVAVDAERDGDAIAIHAVAALNADTATAWRVLTDYNHYTQFIPDLHRSRVVARHETTVTVEQSGDAAVWMFRLPLDITFEINEAPPDGLRSRAIAGSLRALTSRYTLTPAAAGIRLDYSGRVSPGYPLLRVFEQSTVEHNIARQFQALADEIERRYRVAEK
jgi:ribosome-associated toxin RatA of RatAB toxin-antitoxin module